MLDWWHLQPSVSNLEINYHDSLGLQESPCLADPRDCSPRDQAGLRSLMELTPQIDFDAFARYVDPLPTVGVPGYAELDLRLGWRPSPSFELSITGSNLLHSSHMEFGSETLPVAPTEVPRSVFVKAVVRY